MSTTTSIDLSKGQKIDLTKSNPGLTKVFAGLGWDINQNKTGGADFDLDAVAVLLDANGKLVKAENLVYFRNLTSPCNSVKHSGDNLTGQGDGDDEVINVDLAAIPADVDTVVFAANVYDAAARRQNFGMVTNAFVRLVNADTNVELMKFDLSEDASIDTGVELGKIYRHQGEWKFQAIGTTFTGTLQDLVNKYSA